MAGALADRAQQGVADERELAFAAHEPRTEALDAHTDARDDLLHPIGAHGLRLALSGHGRQLVRDDRSADEPMGLPPDHDLAGAGAGLEPLGGIDRVTGNQRVAARRVAHHHRARVDADAHGEAHADRLLELVVQADKSLAHLDRRVHRPQRVVLVHHRRAEDRHHRVAHELADRAAMALDDGCHLPEEPGHEPVQALGILALADGRRADHVAEKRGDRLAGFARRLDRPERRSARPAEAAAVVATLAALRAAPHGWSLRALQPR